MYRNVKISNTVRLSENEMAQSVIHQNFIITSMWSHSPSKSLIYMMRGCNDLFVNYNCHHWLSFLSTKIKTAKQPKPNVVDIISTNIRFLPVCILAHAFQHCFLYYGSYIQHHELHVKTKTQETNNIKKCHVVHALGVSQQKIMYYITSTIVCTMPKIACFLFCTSYVSTDLIVPKTFPIYLTHSIVRKFVGFT